MAQEPFFTDAANALEQGYMEGQEGTVDPMISQNLMGDEAATEEEEQLLAIGSVDMQEYLFSEEGLAAVTQVLNGAPDQLYSVIPQIAVPLLHRAKNTIDSSGQPAPSSVFFGDGGLLGHSVDLIFDIAAELEIPGYNDPDQYAAAIIGVYKAAGEEIIDTQDGESMLQARELGVDMALTAPDGSRLPDDHYAEAPAAAGAQQDPLAAGVQQGLLAQQGVQ